MATATASAPPFIPTAAELQYTLHNSFDRTTPRGWEDEAIERIYSEWDMEDFVPSDFWSVLIFRILILICAALAGITFNLP